MAKFCGKCGLQIDETTGLCPKCNADRLNTYQSIPAEDSQSNTEKPVLPANKPEDETEPKKVQKTIKQKIKSFFIKLIAVILVLAVLAAGTSVALVYYDVLDIPIVSSVLEYFNIKETKKDKETTNDPQSEINDEDDSDNLDNNENTALVSSISDLPTHLFIYAENTLLEENYDTEIDLHICVPTEWETEPLEIYSADGSLLSIVEDASTVNYEEINDMHSDSYNNYKVNITIPPARNGETAYGIYAQMGDKKSDTLILYRDITVTDEMISDLGQVLDETSALVDSFGTVSDDGSIAFSTEPSEILSQALAFLENHEGVADVWMENEAMIRFITVDGLNGSFVMSQVYEDEGMNLAGTGSDAGASGVTTSMRDLDNIFVYDKTFRSASIDPDVLLMCPIRSTYSNRKGKTSESAAKKLAKEYNGEFTLVTDKKSLSDPLNVLLSGDLDKYGTIMLITHGGPLDRNDGSKSFMATLYSSQKEATASAALEQFIDDNPDLERSNFVSANNSGLDVSEARLILGVQYEYWPDNNIKFIHTGTHYDIYATTNLFIDIYNDSWFPNTLFYLGACYSFLDDRFNQFLLDHGASCVIGYTGSISCEIEQSICKSIFQNDMVKENTEVSTTRNYNVEEAIDNGYNKLMEGLASASTNVRVGAVTNASAEGEYNFVYEGYGSISGKVSDQNHNLLSGVKVSSYRYWNGHLQKEKEVSTDSHGNYSFDELPWGMYLLQAQDGKNEAFHQISFATDEQKNIDFTLGTNRDIVLVLDTSGSMTGTPISETIKASSNFINTILKQDARVGIVTYSDGANITSGFSANKILLNNTVSAIGASGGTNIEEGLSTAYGMLKNSDAKKKIIVLMGDGEPNDGKVGDELISYAGTIKNNGVYIYTLGFFESLSSDEKANAQSLMERIASPGCHYEVADADNLGVFFGDVADQINGQKYYYIRIACPVDVTVSYDGEKLCSTEDDLNTRTTFGTLTFEESKNSSESSSDNRVKVLRLKDNGSDYDICIEGNGKGRMNYTIGFMDENGEYSDLRKFNNIKITKKTVINTVAKHSNTTVLDVDKNGDGKYDLKYKADENGRGKLVDYTYVIYIIIGVITLIAAPVIFIKVKKHFKNNKGARL